MMARSRKGISPVIATVIIVAVAIAISIAVAGWLFGLWGGLASGTAQIQVSSVSVNTTTASIYVVNTGSGADQILKIELNNGTKTVTLTPTSAFGQAVTSYPIKIQANQKGWIYASVPTTITLTPGQSVTVKIYFEKSGTVTVPVTVQG